MLKAGDIPAQKGEETPVNPLGVKPRRSPPVLKVVYVLPAFLNDRMAGR